MRLMPTRALGGALALAAGLALSAPAARADLLVNGGFENPGCGYCALGAGSTAITGWTTFLSGVEYYATAEAADGVQVVDLANYVYSTGGIRQSFATQAGSSYKLRFAAGNTASSGRTGDGTVRVQLSDGAADFFDVTFDTAVVTSAAYAWKTISVDFVATGNSTTLSFSNTQNSFTHFALIDGVGVQAAAVPEPGTWALWLAGLAGVGAVARRRQPRRR